MVDRLTDANVQEIRYVFSLFDNENNNGNVVKPEMRKFLESLGIFLSIAELDELFNMFDSSGNGQIDFAEFLSLMTKSFDETPDEKNEE